MEDWKQKTEEVRKHYVSHHAKLRAMENSCLHKAFTLSNELIKEIEKCIPCGAKVLEAGCGGGHFSKALVTKGYKMISTDFSSIACDVAQENYPDLDVREEDAQALSFDDGTFDAVVSVEFIEHLFNVDEHLREVNRVLKKNGYYFIKTPNKVVHYIYYNIIFRNKISVQHPSVMSRYGLKRRLAANGFDVCDFISMRHLQSHQIEKIKDLFPSVLGLDALFAKFAGSLPLHVFPPILCPTIICIAKKI